MSNRILYFIILLACSSETKVAYNKLSCLKVDFKKNYPFLIRKVFETVFVGDGNSIYKFDNHGNLKDKIKVYDESSDQIFIDFLPLSNSELDQFLVTSNEKLYLIERGKSSLLCEKFGEKIRKLPNKNVVITLFQRYDSVKNKIFKGLKSFDYNSFTLKEYPLNFNLESYSLEIIGNNIGVESAGYFYLLPSDYNNTEIIKLKIPTSKYDKILFLGQVNSKYIFLAPNYKTRKDHVLVCDENLKLISDEIVEFETKDLSSKITDEDLYNLLETPSGNIYYFDNQTFKIFLLRNHRNEICFYLLSDLISI